MTGTRADAENDETVANPKAQAIRINSNVTAGKIKRAKRYYLIFSLNRGLMPKSFQSRLKSLIAIPLRKGKTSQIPIPRVCSSG